MDTLRAPERWLTSSDEVAAQLRPALRRARDAGPTPAAHAEMWSSLAAKLAVMPPVAPTPADLAPAAATAAVTVKSAWWLALTAVVAATVGYGAAKLTSSANEVPARVRPAVAPPVIVEAVPRESALATAAESSAVPAAAPLDPPTPVPVHKLRSRVTRVAAPSPDSSSAARVAAASSQAQSAAPAEARLGDWAAELDLLARARRVVATAPGRALELTAEHARQFEAGVLVQEREVLAIEALSRLGRRELAAMRARRFAERYPDSPHRVRLAALLEQ